MLYGKVIVGLAVALALLGIIPAARAQEPRSRERLNTVRPCVAGNWFLLHVTNGTANPVKGLFLHAGSGCSVQIECNVSPGVVDPAAAYSVQTLTPGAGLAGFACPGSTNAIGFRTLSPGGNFRLSVEP